MRIIMAGASGYLGRPLVARLREHGHRVTRLVRRAVSGADEVRWSPGGSELEPSVLDGADVVLNLCGAGVGDKRWNDGYKRVLVDSRVQPTGTLARALAVAEHKPSVLLNASAVGVYGDRGDEELTEESASGQGFFTDLVTQWEAATAPVRAAGVRVVHLRSGLVLAPHGGLLGPVLPLFKLGLGGRMGSGRQWMPWISLADELGAIEHLLHADVAGPVNICGPAPVRNVEFARVLARVVHRPRLVPAPRFGMRLVVGEFAGQALSSLRVYPTVLRRTGYQYSHGDLESALQWATGGQP